MWTVEEISVGISAGCMFVTATIIIIAACRFSCRSVDYLKNNPRHHKNKHISRLRNLALAATLVLSLMCISQGLRDIVLLLLSVDQLNQKVDFSGGIVSTKGAFILDLTTIIFRTFDCDHFIFIF